MRFLCPLIYEAFFAPSPKYRYFFIYHTARIIKKNSTADVHINFNNSSEFRKAVYYMVWYFQYMYVITLANFFTNQLIKVILHTVGNIPTDTMSICSDTVSNISPHFINSKYKIFFRLLIIFEKWNNNYTIEQVS